jgi:hypothetical protein
VCSFAKILLRGVADLRKAKRGGGDLISYRRKLSSDARLIVALLKKQPQEMDELCKRAGVHPSTFYRFRSLLEKKGILKKTEGGYALWTYDEKEKLIADVVDRWKRLGFRYPTVEEIADEAGIVPEEAKILVYKTKKETGWFMPNEGIIDSAREKLGEALVYAARMKEGKPSNLAKIYSDDPETVKEGERFLKEHPRMLPKLSEDGMRVTSWPTEASKYLGKDHQPKDRRRGTLLKAY